MLYVVREWVDPVGTEHTDYYAQDLSIVDVPKIDLVDSAPKTPDVERVVFDSPEWLIKSVVLSGIEYSYLYNRHASVWCGAGDGEWVCRKNKITGFVVLENGILVMSEDGAQFCPANRKGLNAVGECGRVWKSSSRLGKKKQPRLGIPSGVFFCFISCWVTKPEPLQPCKGHHRLPICRGLLSLCEGCR